MKPSQKYLLCPQCGSRRFCIKDDQGKEHFVYVLQDQTVVYAKTGDPIPDDLDTGILRCADCSWKGPIRKLVSSFDY